MSFSLPPLSPCPALIMSTPFSSSPFSFSRHLASNHPARFSPLPITLLNTHPFVFSPYLYWPPPSSLSDSPSPCHTTLPPPCQQHPSSPLLILFKCPLPPLPELHAIHPATIPYSPWLHPVAPCHSHPVLCLCFTSLPFSTLPVFHNIHPVTLSSSPPPCLSLSFSAFSPCSPCHSHPSSWYCLFSISPWLARYSPCHTITLLPLPLPVSFGPWLHPVHPLTFTLRLSNSPCLASYSPCRTITLPPLASLPLSVSACSPCFGSPHRPPNRCIAEVTIFTVIYTAYARGVSITAAAIFRRWWQRST